MENNKSNATLQAIKNVKSGIKLSLFIKKKSSCFFGIAGFTPIKKLLIKVYFECTVILYKTLFSII